MKWNAVKKLRPTVKLFFASVQQVGRRRDGSGEFVGKTYTNKDRGARSRMTKAEKKAAKKARTLAKVAGC